MSYYVHNHRGVKFHSISPSDIVFLVYAIRINMLDALRGSSSS